MRPDPEQIDQTPNDASGNVVGTDIANPNARAPIVAPVIQTDLADGCRIFWHGQPVGFAERGKVAIRTVTPAAPEANTLIRNKLLISRNSEGSLS